MLRLLRVPRRCFYVFLMSFVRLKILSTYQQFIRNSLQKHIYDRQSLWISATHTNTNSRRQLLRSYKAFVYCWSWTSRPAGSLTDAIRTRRRRKRCERGRKRGKRGVIRARLRANPTRPALPTLMLSNVRSLENKLDLIQLTRSTTAWGKGLLLCLFSLKHG